MTNVEIKTEGSKVILTFDASKTFGQSKSGKTTVIASTQGNKKIVVGGKEINVGLNAYTK